MAGWAVCRLNESQDFSSMLRNAIRHPQTARLRNDLGIALKSEPILSIFASTLLYDELIQALEKTGVYFVSKIDG
jgi:hypothetical protein